MTDGAALLTPADVRRLAAELGVRPTKRLGQNFVIDPNTVRRIVRTAEVSSSDVVVEVGPGLGSLTLPLLEATAAVVAIEVDPTLADALPGTVADRYPAGADRLTVVHADALSVGALPGRPPTAFVANLPYNVAVPVVLHLLATQPSIERGLVMVQSEVADRITAGSGSRDYGIPSVKTAWWAVATRAGAVPRAVFWPVPNVDSALVRLRRRPPPPATVDRSEVFRVVDAAFAQRRKMLRSALAGWAGSPAAANAALQAASVAPTARGEDLDLDAFVRLAEAGVAVRSDA